MTLCKLIHTTHLEIYIPLVLDNFFQLDPDIIFDNIIENDLFCYSPRIPFIPQGMQEDLGYLQLASLQFETHV